MKSKLYHVFTNHKDKYVSTLKEANEIFKRFKSDYGNVRMYKIIDNGSDIFDEEFIKGHGSYPY